MFILYDGVCALCNKLVVFVLKRDKNGIFRFASLQSPFAKNLLNRHDKDTSSIETIYLVLPSEASGETVLAESKAVVAILERLNSPWPFVASILRIIPASLANLGYRIIAKTRYKLFGKYEECPLPPPEWRERFR